MESPEAVEARLRAEHPFLEVQEGDSTRRLTEAEYEARLAEMVAATLERQTADAAEAATTTERDAIKGRYQALKDGSMTSREVQDTLARVIKDLYAP